MMRSRFLYILLIAALGGCESASRPVTAELQKDPASLTSTSAVATAGVPLVVVDYLASIDPDAKELYTRIYRQAELQTGHIFGKYEAQGDVDGAVAGSIDESMAKTLYYTTEFAKVLRAKLPPGAVVLRPLAVTLVDKDHIGARAVGPDVPGVMSVECWVNVSLLRAVEGRLWTSDTLGCDLTPRITIAANNQSSDRASRILASTDVPRKVDNETRFYTCIERLAIPAFADEDPQFRKIVRERRPAKRPGYFAFDWKTYEGNQRAFDAQAATKGGNLESAPFRPVWDFYANVVVDLLNQCDDLADPAFRQYAALYSPALAGPSASLTLAQAALIKKFLVLEQKFLQEQDQQFLDTVYAGEFGDSMRQVLLGEIKFQNGANAIQDAEFRRSLTSSLTSMTYSSLAMKGYVTPEQNMMMQMQIMTAGMQASQAENASMRNLARLFQNELQRVRDDQAEFVLNTASGEERIRVKSLGELRAKLSAIYAKQFGTRR